MSDDDDENEKDEVEAGEVDEYMGAVVGAGFSAPIPNKVVDADGVAVETGAAAEEADGLAAAPNEAKVEAEVPKPPNDLGAARSTGG